MKALRLAVAASMLAGCIACPLLRAADAVAPGFSGEATRSYLGLVGQVRSQMNADNKDRIPSLIGGADIVMLGNEAHRLGVLRQSLSRFSKDGVDPEAVQFAANIDAILDSYQAVCADAAELYRELGREDASMQGTPRLAELRSRMRAPQVDILNAVAVLVDAMGQVAPDTRPGVVSTGAMVRKLQEDRDRVASAKDVHHLFTLKLKEVFAKRYPDVDWSAKEILP